MTHQIFTPSWCTRAVTDLEWLIDYHDYYTRACFLASNHLLLLYLGSSFYSGNIFPRSWSLFRSQLFTPFFFLLFLDLASHCRLLLYNRPKHKLLYRWLGLYPLYILAEVAIIATDLAELLGSAIALCLLFPKLELWHGVLITAFDVILILGIGDPLRGRPVRIFELLIAAMVCVRLFIASQSLLQIRWFIGSCGSRLYDRHRHKSASRLGRCF